MLRTPVADSEGATEVGDEVAGDRRRPSISPWASTEMATLSSVPLAVTTNTRASGVLVVMESSFSVVRPAKVAFSDAAAGGGIRARKAASKWAVTSAAGIGRSVTAPNSQRACSPAGVFGRFTARADAGTDEGADEDAAEGAADRCGAAELQPASVAASRPATSTTGARQRAGSGFNAAPSVISLGNDNREEIRRRA